MARRTGSSSSALKKAAMAGAQSNDPQNSSRLNTVQRRKVVSAVTRASAAVASRRWMYADPKPSSRIAPSVSIVALAMATIPNMSGTSRRASTAVVMNLMERVTTSEAETHLRPERTDPLSDSVAISPYGS